MDDQRTDNLNQTESSDPRSDRRTRIEERRARRSSGGWAGGAILIGLGILLLLKNMGSLELDNWWALFILIPAVGGLGAAWSNYQEAGGRLTRAVRSSLFGALILILVTAMFLFSLDWFIFGPVLLILGGVGLLLNTVLPE